MLRKVNNRSKNYYYYSKRNTRQTYIVWVSNDQFFLGIIGAKEFNLRCVGLWSSSLDVGDIPMIHPKNIVIVVKIFFG